MRNYIRAELYRNFNRAYFWSLTAVMSVLAILVNIFIKITSVSDVVDMFSVFQIGTFLIVNSSIYFVLMTIDMITGEEQKNLTLKNAISFGLSRNKLVLSKNIATIILSLVSVIIILIAFFGSGIILFGFKGASAEIVKVFLLRLIATTSLSIGAISVGTFLAFTIKNNNVFSITYVGFFSIMPVVIDTLSKLVSKKFIYIYNVFIVVHLKRLSMGKSGAITNNDLFPISMIETINMKSFISATILGIIYFVVFTILSIVVVRRKEIK